MSEIMTSREAIASKKWNRPNPVLQKEEMYVILLELPLSHDLTWSLFVKSITWHAQPTQHICNLIWFHRDNSTPALACLSGEKEITRSISFLTRHPIFVVISCRVPSPLNDKSQICPPSLPYLIENNELPYQVYFTKYWFL